MAGSVYACILSLNLCFHGSENEIGIASNLHDIFTGMVFIQTRKIVTRYSKGIEDE